MGLIDQIEEANKLYTRNLNQLSQTTAKKSRSELGESTGNPMYTADINLNKMPDILTNTYGFLRTETMAHYKTMDSKLSVTNKLIGELIDVTYKAWGETPNFNPMDLISDSDSTLQEVIEDFSKDFLDKLQTQQNSRLAQLHQEVEESLEEAVETPISSDPKQHKELIKRIKDTGSDITSKLGSTLSTGLKALASNMSTQLLTYGTNYYDTEFTYKISDSVEKIESKLGTGLNKLSQMTSGLTSGLKNIANSITGGLGNKMDMYSDPEVVQAFLKYGSAGIRRAEALYSERVDKMKELTADYGYTPEQAKKVATQEMTKTGTRDYSRLTFDQQLSDQRTRKEHQRQLIRDEEDYQYQRMRNEQDYWYERMRNEEDYQRQLVRNEQDYQYERMRNEQDYWYQRMRNEEDYQRQLIRNEEDYQYQRMRNEEDYARSIQQRRAQEERDWQQSALLSAVEIFKNPKQISTAQQQIYEMDRIMPGLNFQATEFYQTMVSVFDETGEMSKAMFEEIRDLSKNLMVDPQTLLSIGNTYTKYIKLMTKGGMDFQKQMTNVVKITGKLEDQFLDSQGIFGEVQEIGFTMLGDMTDEMLAKTQLYARELGMSITEFQKTAQTDPAAMAEMLLSAKQGYASRMGIDVGNGLDQGEMALLQQIGISGFESITDFISQSTADLSSSDQALAANQGTELGPLQRQLELENEAYDHLIDLANQDYDHKRSLEDEFRNHQRSLEDEDYNHQRSLEDEYRNHQRSLEDEFRNHQRSFEDEDYNHQRSLEDEFRNHQRSLEDDYRSYQRHWEDLAYSRRMDAWETETKIRHDWANTYYTNWEKLQKQMDNELLENGALDTWNDRLLTASLGAEGLGAEAVKAQTKIQGASTALIDGLGSFIGSFAGTLGGKAVGGIGKLFNRGKDKSAGDAPDIGGSLDTGSLGGKAVGGIGKLFGKKTKGKSIDTGDMTAASTSGGAGTLDTGTLGETLSKGGAKGSSVDWERIAADFAIIAGGIALVAGSVYILGKIKPETMKTGAENAKLVGEGFSNLYEPVGIVLATSAALGLVMEKTPVDWDTLVQGLGAVEMGIWGVAVPIGAIGLISDTFDPTMFQSGAMNAKYIGEGMRALYEPVGVILAASIAMGSLLTGSMGFGWLALAQGLAAVEVGIAGVAAPIGAIGLIDSKVFERGRDNARLIGEAMDGLYKPLSFTITAAMALGSIFTGTLGIGWIAMKTGLEGMHVSLNEIGDMLKEFGDKVQGIDTIMITGAANAGLMLNKLVTTMPRNDSFFTEFFLGEKMPVDTMKNNIQAIADSVKYFQQELGDGVSPNVIESAANAAKVLYQLVQNMPRENKWADAFIGYKIPAEEMVGNIQAIGLSVLTFQASVGGMTNVDGLKEKAEAALALVNTLSNMPRNNMWADAFVGTSMTNKQVVTGVGNLAQVVSVFSDTTALIPSDQIQTLGTKAEAAKKLIDMLDDMPRSNWWADTFLGSTLDNDAIIKGISTLGEAVSIFATKTKIISDTSTMESSIEIIKSLLGLYSDLPKKSNKKMSMEDFSSDIKSLSQGLRSFSSNTSDLTQDSVKVSKSVVNLVTGINFELFKDLDSSNIKDAFVNIADGIKAYETINFEEVGNNLNVRLNEFITNLDYENIGNIFRAKLQQALCGTADMDTMTFTITMKFTDLPSTGEIGQNIIEIVGLNRYNNSKLDKIDEYNLVRNDYLKNIKELNSTRNNLLMKSNEQFVKLNNRQVLIYNLLDQFRKSAHSDLDSIYKANSKFFNAVRDPILNINLKIGTLATDIQGADGKTLSDIITDMWSIGTINSSHLTTLEDKFKPFWEMVEDALSGNPSEPLGNMGSGEMDTTSMTNGDPFEKYGVTSKFGPRKAPKAGASTFHKGTDYGLPKGTAIPAFDNGVVIDNNYNKASGNYVIMENSKGYKFSFCHLDSKSPLKVGESVKPGTIMGYCGSTGVSTGPHLHLGVKNPSGEFIDPQKYFGTNPGISSEIANTSKLNELLARIGIVRLSTDFLDEFGEDIFTGKLGPVDLSWMRLKEVGTSGIEGYGRANKLKNNEWAYGAYQFTAKGSMDNTQQFIAWMKNNGYPDIATILGNGSVSGHGGQLADRWKQAYNNNAERFKQAQDAFEYYSYVAPLLQKYGDKLNPLGSKVVAVAAGHSNWLGLGGVGSVISRMAGNTAQDYMNATRSYVRSLGNYSQWKTGWENRMNSEASYLGVHKMGLSRVPYDNYPALLHKDERVLNASEAQLWNNMQQSKMGDYEQSVQDVTVYVDTDAVVDSIGALTDVVKEIYAILKPKTHAPVTQQPTSRPTSNSITQYV